MLRDVSRPGSNWLRFSSLCGSHHLLGTLILGATFAVDFPTGWLQGTEAGTWHGPWNVSLNIFKQSFINTWWSAEYYILIYLNLSVLIAAMQLLGCPIGWQIDVPSCMAQVNHLQGGSDHRPVRLEAGPGSFVSKRLKRNKNGNSNWGMRVPMYTYWGMPGYPKYL
jgi:hypothetical protein